MKISEVGLNLIAKWEGFRANAYQDVGGIWTIGYGTIKYNNGVRVKKGDSITQKQALELLRVQADQHASTIYSYVKIKLNQNQFDALASFQYNLGQHILKNSKLLSCINNQDWIQTTVQMLLYCNAGGKKIQGLVNRRKEEISLFLKPIEKTEGELTVNQYQELKGIIEAQAKQITVQAKQIEVLEASAGVRERAVAPDHKAAWEWAQSQGLVNGKNPNRPLTREQFATIEYRKAAKK